MRTILLTEKLTYFALRLVIFLLLTFFLLYSPEVDSSLPLSTFAVLGIYLLSNFSLLLIRDEKFSGTALPTFLFLFDTAFISTVIYLSQGFESDLYLIYFLVIFMSAIQMKIWQSFLTGTVASFLYLLLWERSGHESDFLSTSLLLRLPFLYMASFFAAFFANKVRETKSRLETRMAQTEKLSFIGQMAAGLAHELKSPLSGIIGFGETLLEYNGEKEPMAKPIKSIIRDAVRCRKIIQDLLAFSHKREARWEVFDLSSVLEGAFSLIEAQAKAQSVRLQFESGHERLPIWGDEDQIRQILTNLSTNAIDAMPDGGTLTIGIFKTEREGLLFAGLRVSDTGTGIPESVQKRIFEPFFTTKDPDKGTGLGLSLVHEIVQRHGGRVEFETKEGRGTTFTLTLPLA